MNTSKLKYIPFFILLLGLGFMSCKTKSFTPDNFEGAQIVFGSGGGFTGVVDKFIILENGQIFKNKKRKKTFEESIRLKKKEVAPFFEECKTLMKSYDFMKEPGNLYFFITYKNGKDASRIVWGDHREDAQPEVLAFYEKLQALVH